MFTRHVTMQLRANSAAEFTHIIENEIIPLLRKQKGFRDEITFVAPERSEAVANSFWDTKEDAEAYERRAYPAVLKALEKVAEGTPDSNLRGGQFDLAQDRYQSRSSVGGSCRPISGRRQRIQPMLVITAWFWSIRPR